VKGPDNTDIGTHGRANELPIADDPSYAETVCHWLITAPAYHPLWSQYMIAVVRLTDNPDFLPPYRQFSGATHELLEYALNPGFGHFTAERLIEFFQAKNGIPILTPINIAYQMQGTDEEAEVLAKWAVWGIINGRLNAEVADAPDKVRENWKVTLDQTLDHMRNGHQ
jgi:hypothetical protein